MRRKLRYLLAIGLSVLNSLTQSAQAQQTRVAKVALSTLTAQGFEIKAATGNQAGVV
jgi:hypothetical protein